MLKNNYLALILTLTAALAWLKINDFAAEKGWVESKLSRKLVHIGTGPIFVVCWLMFPNDSASRYLAALVPLAITGQFILIGTGILKDEAKVKTLSRTGDRREILYGPLFYGIIFVILTIVYWYDSPIGITALMVLCGGDGLADILGRRFGRRELPWSTRKTWAGAAGMFFGSWSLSALILLIFTSQGIFTQPMSAFWLPITVISLAATVVESLPLKEIDNITITAAAVILGHLLY